MSCGPPDMAFETISMLAVIHMLDNALHAQLPVGAAVISTKAIASIESGQSCALC